VTGTTLSGVRVSGALAPARIAAGIARFEV
jgi:hypothetical protein